MSRKKKENELGEFLPMPTNNRNNKGRDLGPIADELIEKYMNKKDEEGNPFWLDIEKVHKEYDLSASKIKRYAKVDGKTVVTDEFAGLTSGLVNALRRKGCGIKIHQERNNMVWLREKVTKKK